ncbi:MAG: TonB-dependent receptor [Bryobacterales bacterium]|nr:TonB-dependent receptor [Bryobacterales bacterium]
MIRVFLFALALSVCALAQTSGTITGTVADSTQAVMPGVTIKALNEQTSEERTTVTNEQGTYTLPFLPPGPYKLEFSMAGFKTMVQRMTLNVTERVAVNMEMQPSAVAESVEVSGEAPLLQTESTALGRVVDETTVKQLPLATRNFTQLLALSPGVNAQLNDAAALGRGTQNVSAGGARRVSNAMQIDGVDVVNIHTNSAAENALSSNGVLVPSPEAIQEFKVQTALFDAAHGRSAGANVNLVTRSGSAKFHGSVFEFLRNEKLNANSFFFNSTGIKRPVLKQNQFGGTFGGPVWKGKTFFFASYQGTRQRNGVSGSTSLRLPEIPVDRSRAALGAAFGGRAGARGGLQVARDGSNIHPVALALMNYKKEDGSFLVPSPQIPGGGVNYAVSIPATFREDQGSLAVDHNVHSNNKLAFKMFWADQPQYRPFPLATVPGFGVTQDFRGGNFSLTDTHTFSANVVNEARVGYARLNGAVLPETLVNIADIGMRRFNQTTVPGIPDINVTAGFRIGYSVDADQAGTQHTFQYSDTLSWVRGKHTWRFGGEARRYRINYFNNNRQRGALAFQSLPDFLLGLPGTPIAQGGNGTGFSNLNSTSAANGNVGRADRITDYAAYIQDDWKATSRLTLNLGLRYEFLGFSIDSQGRTGNFDTRLYTPPPAGGSTSAGFVQASNTSKPLSGLPLVKPILVDNSDRNNLAPRLGFAYRLTNKMALRGGTGMFFDRLSNQLGLRAALSAPNYVRSDLQAAAASAIDLSNPFPILPQRSEFPIMPTLYAPPYTTARPALSLNAIDPALKTPYMLQYSLNVQYEVLRNTLLEVGYAGTRGINLPAQRLLNQALLASPENPINGITTNTAANAQNRVPYLGFSPTGLIWIETSTDSRYDSLQVSLTQRLTKGLRFLGAYTFSKTLDTHSGDGNSVLVSIDGDQHSMRLNKGVANFDRTHRMVFNFVYDLPRFADSGAMKWVANGWQLAGVAVAQSGLPISITDSSAATLYGVTTSRATWAAGATVETAEKQGRTQDRLSAYFNTSAFVRAGTGFGNVGRNVLRGPVQQNIDLSAIKRFPVSEQRFVEFRAEAFNFTNRVNFETPNGNVTSANFGFITGLNGNPRILQFALKFVF